MKTKYTVDYFIKKFKSIPPNKWTTEAFVASDGKCGAMGHCEVKNPVEITPEGRGLYALFSKINESVYYVNEQPTLYYPQKTPKRRILAALRKIKKEQN